MPQARRPNARAGTTHRRPPTDQYTRIRTDYEMGSNVGESQPLPLVRIMKYQWGAHRLRVRGGQPPRHHPPLPALPDNVHPGAPRAPCAPPTRRDINENNIAGVWGSPTTTPTLLSVIIMHYQAPAPHTPATETPWVRAQRARAGERRAWRLNHMASRVDSPAGAWPPPPPLNASMWRTSAWASSTRWLRL
jgi:hypothetical protein